MIVHNVCFFHAVYKRICNDAAEEPEVVAPVPHGVLFTRLHLSLLKLPECVELRKATVSDPELMA